MANPNANSTPEPCRAWVNKARKKKFANNGNERREYKGWFAPIDPFAARYNSIPPSERTARRGIDGEITRTKWSTPIERETENNRFGPAEGLIFDKWVK